MAGLHAFGIALIAAAVATAPALAQEAVPESVASAPSAAPAGQAVQDVAIEIGGIRARVVLQRGTALEGLLPLGPAYWERPAPGFDYEETDASDPSAGLRLYFVLGMEGAIFFRKSDIAAVKDLGVISDEAAAAIRQNLLDARRKALEEKEARLKESLRRILGTERVEDAMPAKAAPAVPVPSAPESVPSAGAPTAAPAPVASPAGAPATGPMTKEDEARAKAEARRIRGEELLAKYPPPDWSESRLETILWRERVAKIPPDAVEAPFVKESDLWIEALRRREAAEKKAAGPASSGTGAPASAGSPAPR